MYEDLTEQYLDQREICSNIDADYLNAATRDGCAYGVTCARCGELTAGSEVVAIGGAEEEATAIGEFYPGEVLEIRGPQGTVMYVSPSYQIYTLQGTYYRRSCVEYKPSADMYCNIADLYCAGDGVVG